MARSLDWEPIRTDCRSLQHIPWPQNWVLFRCFTVRVRTMLTAQSRQITFIICRAIFGFAILKPMSSILPDRLGGGYFGPKENCELKHPSKPLYYTNYRDSIGTVQSAATAAGGLTTLFVAAVPAMYHLGLMTTPRQDFGKLILLTTISAFYGIFFAVPLRRYYIRKYFFSPCAYHCQRVIQSNKNSYFLLQLRLLTLYDHFMQQQHLRRAVLPTRRLGSSHSVSSDVSCSRQSELMFLDYSGTGIYSGGCIAWDFPV